MLLGGSQVKLNSFAFFCATTLAIGLAVLTLNAQRGKQPQQPRPPSTSAAATTSAIQQKIEEYLRDQYAWGPTYKLKFEPMKETPIPNLYQVRVAVSVEGQGDTATFYVTKDGRYLIRAELEDMNTDPAIAIRKQMSLADYPSKGPADAKVVLVEYADYECPSCRQLDAVLRGLLPTMPQVRLVYKDFPLVQIHPWAMTAASAARCVFHQAPSSFWKFHDLLFDNQAIIGPDNAYQKMQDYATQSGADATALKSCMADPQTQEDVKRSLTEGESLHISNTPTIFVNGHRLIGPDAPTLQQFIQYDLSRSKSQFR